MKKKIKNALYYTVWFVASALFWQMCIWGWSNGIM